MQHCAKRSTSIAYALKLIRSTQRHQLDHAHRALNASNVAFKITSSAIIDAIVRQKALCSRAASLVAVTAVLHPRLSNAERHYLYDLKALDAQCTRVLTHINAEKRRISVCTEKLDRDLSSVIDENQLHLAKQLLAGQTQILQSSNKKLVEIQSCHICL
jgi:hypothetical protein